MSYISSAVILYGRFLTYKILLTSGGRRTCNHNKVTDNWSPSAQLMSITNSNDHWIRDIRKTTKCQVLAPKSAILVSFHTNNVSNTCSSTTTLTFVFLANAIAILTDIVNNYPQFLQKLVFIYYTSNNNKWRKKYLNNKHAYQMKSSEVPSMKL